MTASGIGVRVQLQDESRKNGVRFASNLCSFPSAGFDLPYVIQDFLLYIAFGFEFGERFTG